MKFETISKLLTECFIHNQGWESLKMRSKKKMWVIIGVLFSILGIIIVFFNISYSKTRTEFEAITGTLLNKISLVV